LKEVGGVTLALGEDRHEYIGPGDFLTAGRLHMDDRALDDALERGRGPRVLAVRHDEAVEFLVDEFLEISAERLDIDVATVKHGGGVPVLGQGQKQMFERREFMRTLAR